MALAIVQNQGVIHPSQIPGSITLGSAPTAGNLLVCFLGVNIAVGSLVIDTTKWTIFQRVGDPDRTTDFMIGVFRYVQGGDTATLPAFATAGTTYWTHMIWEISGVVGTWAQDMLFAVFRGDLFNSAIDSQRTLPAIPVFANALALTCGAAYNGNGNPTITGSWTLDVSSNNPSNYGSLGGAHRAMAPNDTIDGAWTLHFVGTNPSAGMVIIGTAQPTSPYPRNYWTFDSNASNPGHPTTPTLPFTPLQGNLLIAILGWGNGTATNPTFDTNWTTFIVQTATTDYKVGLYRYVQAGDTATLKNICTAGSAVYSLNILEMSGVSGVFSTDVQGALSGFQSSAAPWPLTTQTTTVTKQFVFVSYSEFGSSNVGQVLSSPWTDLMLNQNNLRCGTDVMYIQYCPNAGTAVSGTITTGVGGPIPQGYIELIFNGGGPPVSVAKFSDAQIWGPQFFGALAPPPPPPPNAPSAITQSVTPLTILANTPGNTVLATLGAVGGQQPYTFSFAVSDANLTISGSSLNVVASPTFTPNTTPTYTLRVTDALGNVFTDAARTYTVPAGPSAVTLTGNQCFDNSPVGALVSNIAVTGGSMPFAFSYSGAPDTNFNLSPISGGSSTLVVSPTGPGSIGTQSVNTKATDAAGLSATSGATTITVQDHTVGGVVTTFQLQNLSAFTSPGFMRVGMPFKKGDVPAGSVVSLFNGASPITAQFDQRTTYDSDGSLKFAVCTIRDTTYAANEIRTYTAKQAPGSWNNTTTRTISDITGNTNFKVSVTNLRTTAGRIDPVNYSITNSGSGLVTCTATITDAAPGINGGSGATATCTLASGKLSSLTIQPGSGNPYTLPAISFTVNGGATKPVVTLNLAGVQVGSGAYTLDVNTVLNQTLSGVATRLTQIAAGPVSTTWMAWGQATDNTGGAAYIHLKGYPHITIWEDGAGGIADFEYGVVMAQDWFGASSGVYATPKFRLLYNATLQDGASVKETFNNNQHQYQSWWLTCSQGSDGDYNRGRRKWRNAMPTLIYLPTQTYWKTTKLVPPFDIAGTTGNGPSWFATYLNSPADYTPCQPINVNAQIDSTGGSNARGNIMGTDSYHFLNPSANSIRYARQSALSGLGVPYQYRSNDLRTRPGDSGVADVASTPFSFRLTGPASYASFQASQSTTTMTVTTLPTPLPLAKGFLVTGGTMPANNIVVKQLTGPAGGIGTYQMSQSSTVASTPCQSTLNYAFDNSTGVNDGMPSPVIAASVFPGAGASMTHNYVVPSGGPTWWVPSSGASHAGNYCYFMYLYEGERFMLEALQNLATNMNHQQNAATGVNFGSILTPLYYNIAPYQALFSIPNEEWYGVGSMSLPNNTRATAWANNIIGCAAGITPDGDTCKNMLRALSQQRYLYAMRNIYGSQPFTAGSGFMPASQISSGVWMDGVVTGPPNAGITSFFMHNLIGIGSYFAYMLTEDQNAKTMGDMMANFALSFASTHPYRSAQEFGQGLPATTGWSPTNDYLGTAMLIPLSVVSINKPNTVTYSPTVTTVVPSNGDKLYFQSQGNGVTFTVPTEITQGTPYYIYNLNTAASTFEIVTDPTYPAAGTLISFSKNYTNVGIGYYPANSVATSIATSPPVLAAQGSLLSPDNYVAITRANLAMAAWNGNAAAIAALPAFQTFCTYIDTQFSGTIKFNNWFNWRFSTG